MLEDLRANSWSLRPCCMVLAYRIAHFCSVWRKKNVLNNLWAAPVLVLYRVITECLFGYEIQAAATIGRRFTIHHGYAVVINKHVVAGDDFTIRHGVTIGNRGTNSLACPVIGDGVELGRMSSCLATLLSVITLRLALAAWCLTVFRTMRWW
ncbi:Colanic acid biosynthesis acetyl transferase WcaB [Salmonella enterica subsp. arizonae]|nr:Colanic acid biosynthesis acetyl transferase WcaB [Salmonella enterica subsp. arizonae]